MANSMFYPGQIIALPKDCAQTLITQGTGDSALLYLHLLCHGQTTLTPEVVSSLKWDATRLTNASQVLGKLGLLPQSATPPVAPTPIHQPAQLDSPPEYTMSDLTAELDSPTSQFQSLIGAVQQCLGKILSTADLKYLFTIYDHLALPAEVILLLVNWCIEEHQRKYGSGHMPKLSIISRQAFSWKRRGIDTMEEAEQFLKKMVALRSNEGRLLAIVGVQGRIATERERPYLEGWIDIGLGDEIITLAYETTLFQKQNMNWNYMNSILKRWHQKGYRTVADVHAGERRPSGGTYPNQSKGTTGQVPPASGDANRRVQEDMERMRAFMKAQKEQEGGGSHGL